METPNYIVVYGSLILGLIGTTLGIINLVRSIKSDSVKVKVIPEIYAMVQDGT